MRTIARYARRLSPQTALLLAVLVVVGTLALLSAPGNGLGRRLGLGASPGGTGPQATVTLITNDVTSDYATSYASLHDLKADADLVLLGTVTGIQAATYLQDFKYIETTYTFRVEAVLGGKRQAQVAGRQFVPIQQVGGTAGGRADHQSRRAAHGGGRAGLCVPALPARWRARHSHV
jgi:hypothetical protein